MNITDFNYQVITNAVNIINFKAPPFSANVSSQATDLNCRRNLPTIREMKIRLPETYKISKKTELQIYKIHK